MADISSSFALILLNGIFAMSELAWSRPSACASKRWRADGSRGARTAIKLSDDPSRFLSTVQVGITLISIFNGAFGEASLVARLTPSLVGDRPARALRPPGGAGIVVVVAITFASIVLGELVPKRIAILYPEFLAALVARRCAAVAAHAPLRAAAVPDHRLHHAPARHAPPQGRNARPRKKSPA
jgi:putative hemolysin